MITVHHLENSRSQRVLWLLEELGLEYELKCYSRDPKTMLAPPELKHVHALGKAPVVIDEGRVLAESGAIIECLLQKYDSAHRLHPAYGSAARDQFTYWMHYAEGSAMPPLLMSLVFARIRSAPMPFFAKPFARAIVDKAMAGFIAPQLVLHFDFMESQLQQQDWFGAEQFSAADIQMSFPIEAAEARGALGRRKRLKAWLAAIQKRPAYLAAVKRGGRFELLK